MNYDREDKRLWELIRELRKEDEARTPNFSKVWRKATSKSIALKTVQRRLLTRFAAAAVVAVLIGGSLFFLNYEGSVRR